MNLPNMLTFSRILMVPIMVVLFCWPDDSMRLWSAAVFGIAAITDWFDGYLARRWNQATALGAFLDPVADKIIVSVALILLAGHFAQLWITLMGIIIIVREIVISALREWMASLGKRAEVAVSQLGKIKTTSQMIAIIVLLGAADDSWLNIAGDIALVIATGLTFWSMLVYLKAAWPELRNS